MKNYLFKRCCLAMMVIFTMTNLRAEIFSANEQHSKAVKATELKIDRFLEEQMDKELPQAARDYIENKLSVLDVGSDHQITSGEEALVVKQLKREYFRQLYFLENPGDAGILQATGPPQILSDSPEDDDFAPCPEYRVLTCCEFWALSAKGISVDPRIEAQAKAYREYIKAKYGTDPGVDCDPCDYPNESFPVFIVDQNNMLIDDSYFDISWSHHAGWTAAYDYIFLNQQSVVTVIDPSTGCVWTDTLDYNCCELDVEIVPLCASCDPCANPGQPFFLVVKDQNGNPLGSGYSFHWSNGSTASGINGTVNNQYWVEVTELATGCTSLDTFLIECCKCEVKADFKFDVFKCDVRFTDISSTNSCTTILDYSWDFGDGTGSTAANPIHTYGANGIYTVCMKVTATNGTDTCTSKICREVEIFECEDCKCEVKPDFKYDVKGCDVQFTDTSIPNECTKIIGYSWDFGDGTGSTAANPAHTYASNGLYTVCMKVLATNGTDTCSYKICYDVRIFECEDCKCEVKPDFKYDVKGCDVQFTDTSIPNECTKIIGYSWDFGDGTGSSAVNPAHTYASNGVYTVCMKVLATNGTDTCSYKICYDVEITECEECKCEVKPDFKYDISGCDVRFIDVSIPNECTKILQYSWDFGDGTGSSLANPVHTYTANGVYVVCMKVLATNGKDTCSYQICREIEISECEDCKCELKPEFTFDISGCDVRFTDTSIPNECTKILKYSWDFGDGTGSSVANPVHTYATNGIYKVCMKVLATNGVDTCTYYICHEVEIRECKDCLCEIKPDFKFDISECKVQFIDMSLPNECTKILAYSWDFGDGTGSSAANPVHTYATNGIYNVCMKIAGTNGVDTCTYIICKKIEIRECKDCECSVKPDFKYLIEECKVSFVGDAGANECTKVMQYYWDFGDGAVSHLQNPVHTYASNGIYKVCLTVEGNDGTEPCKNTICYEVIIRDCQGCDCKVVPKFLEQYNADDRCEVKFVDNSYTNECTKIMDYHWDFGDGTTSNASSPVHNFPGDGTYLVCLTLTGTNGIVKCQNTLCKKVVIEGCKGVGPVKKSSATSTELNDFDATVYPNPFSSDFSVKFTNPVEQSVEITLVNINGKQIAILLDETKASGEHILSFDAANLHLAHGVYLITIKSGEKLTYKKIIFEK